MCGRQHGHVGHFCCPNFCFLKLKVEESWCLFYILFFPKNNMQICLVMQECCVWPSTSLPWSSFVLRPTSSASCYLRFDISLRQHTSHQLSFSCSQDAVRADARVSGLHSIKFSLEHTVRTLTVFLTDDNMKPRDTD